MFNKRTTDYLWSNLEVWSIRHCLSVLSRLQFFISVFFIAQITSKFCPLHAKKSFKIDGRNCQIKSFMSTEKAPQIFQERLTLQLEHLNEFCGHSQWNYLPPFSVSRNYSHTCKHLIYEKMWRRRNSRSLLRSCFWRFCNQEFKALDEKNSRKNLLHLAMLFWNNGGKFMKIFWWAFQEPEIKLSFHHWF